MAAYLSLEDAAAALGIPTDRLIDLRSQGQVRGFRDGTSWKFPEAEIERLREELPNLSGFGSGILAAGGSSRSGSVLGGDTPLKSGDGSGSDLELGLELGNMEGGSDVNLIANVSEDGSDVMIVSGSGASASSDSNSPLAIDLDDLNLSGAAISHDSGELDLGLSKEAVLKPTPRPLVPEKKSLDAIDSFDDASVDSDEFNLGSDLDLTGDDQRSSIADGSSSPTPPIQKAGQLKLDGDSDDSGDALNSDLAGDSDINLDFGQASVEDGASSLELMDDLELSDSDASMESMASRSSVGGDVLSELDLLAGEMGSGLIGSDSVNLLAGSRDSGSGVDDALADDDDLIISDDDDDLVVSSVGSDISIAGDSGINLMSPSDSGLSLESEPLDLAGSSISALDLGAELGEGSGSGSGRPGSGRRSPLVPGGLSGSAVDFQADEEFQLSPSGIQLDKDESGSQEIAIEDSEAFDAEEVDFGDDAAAFSGEADFGGFDDDASAGAGMGGLSDPGGLDDAAGFGIDEERSLTTTAVGGGTIGGFEVPFTLLQNITLVCILIMLSVGGMLMTDLVRNMWAYSETSAPVSSLTDTLITATGLNP